MASSIPTQPTTATTSAPLKPKTYPRYIRGNDGKLRIQYVNEQGLPIPPISLQQGLYDIFTNDQSPYYGQDPVKPVDDNKENKTPTDTKTSGTTLEDFASQYEAITGKKLPTLQRTGERNNDPSGSTQFDPNSTGYIDKPGWVSATSMLPGAAGMAGRALNAGINLGNHVAVNDARVQSGLQPRDGVMDTVRGVMRDNQGQVGDVNINGEDYSIGIGEKIHGGGGLTPQGNTSLTPEEAHRRGSMFGLNEIDPRQIYSGSIPGTEPQSRDIAGILSGAFSGLRDFFGGLLTSPQTAQAPQAATAQGVFDKFQDRFESIPGQVRNALDSIKQSPSVASTPTNSPTGPTGTNPALGQFGNVMNGFVDLTPETPGSFPTPTTQNPVSSAPLNTGATSSPIMGNLGNTISEVGKKATTGLTDYARSMMPGFR